VLVRKHWLLVLVLVPVRKNWLLVLVLVLVQKNWLLVLMQAFSAEHYQLHQCGGASQ